MDEKRQYTYAELAEANRLLARERERWENYSGNNPDKYRASIKLLELNLKIIETSLGLRS